MKIDKQVIGKIVNFIGKFIFVMIALAILTINIIHQILYPWVDWEVTAAYLLLYSYFACDYLKSRRRLKNIN